MSEEEKNAAIDTLVSMGLTEDDAKNAIEKYGSVEETVNALMAE